jgi:hypothetical protein
MTNKLTQGEKKLLVQFEKATQTDAFMKAVHETRKKLGIPINGLEMTPEDFEHINDLFWLPKNLVKISYPDNKSPIYIFNTSAREIRKFLPIDTPYFSALIRNFVYYNKFFYDELHKYDINFQLSNICQLTDAYDELREIIPDADTFDHILLSTYAKSMERKLLKYPIAVRIHPEASQRDVIDFIKKNWVHIEKMKDDYASETNIKVKNTKTTINTENKKRDNLIYENRNLPAKEIAKILAKEKYILDVGHILKIKSLEKKKREKK